MTLFWINFGYFCFGLIGVLAHILFKLKYLGIKRFSQVWEYIMENQISVALSIFMYLAIFLAWNTGLLSKWMSDFWLFQTKLTWITPLIAYVSDSLFRNLVKDINGAVERKKNGKN